MEANQAPMSSILLIEDDKILQASLQAKLTDAGHKVLATTDLSTAAQTLAAQSDLKLLIAVGHLANGGDGVGFLQQARAGGFRGQTILLSGNVPAKVVPAELATKMGLSLVVRKPIVPSLFLDQVQTVLSQPYLPPDLQQAMDELRDEYRQALPALLAELLTALEIDVKQALMLAHRLHGTAGSYGLAQASQVGAVVEQTLDDGGNIESCQRLVEELAASLTDGSSPPAWSPAQGSVATPTWQTAPVGAHVLVVDDDPSFSGYCAAVLSAYGVRVTQLNSPGSLLATFNEHNPDLVLLDVNMPPYSGLDLCATLRSDTTHDLSIIVTSANVSLNTRIAAYRSGADDWLAKPFLSAELVARVIPRLRRRKAAYDAAVTDHLTGVLIRPEGERRIQDQLRSLRRHGDVLSLAFVDLDHFKGINDAHGHQTGDRVLKGFGEVCTNRLRGTDVVARWGGEEFAIALAGTSETQGKAVLKDLLDRFSACVFEGRTSFSASFSAGMAFAPADGDTLDDLFGIADERLYIAKQTRHCIVATSS